MREEKTKAFVSPTPLFMDLFTICPLFFSVL